MKENELFEYLKDFIPDIKFIGGSSIWDCTSEIFNSRIELKCRPTHYSTMLIEKKKYDSLINSGKNPLYINSTPKGIYLWKLDEHDINWKTEKHNKTTEIPNGSREKIDKEVGYLKIADAFVLQIF